MRESTLIRDARLALSRGDTRVFRNNVGTAYRGRIVKKTERMLLLEDYQIVNFGLCNGSSDLIGWRSLIITPDMVGDRVALFAALEGKTARGRASPEQVAFIRTVRDHGGRAGVFRDVDDARFILDGEQW